MTSSFFGESYGQWFMFIAFVLVTLLIINTVLTRVLE